MRWQFAMFTVGWQERWHTLRQLLVRQSCKRRVRSSTVSATAGSQRQQLMYSKCAYDGSG
jgi:hypothetical protein